MGRMGLFFLFISFCFPARIPLIVTRWSILCCK